MRREPVGGTAPRQVSPAIHQVAAELFAQKGYHATSIREIAEGAGLSKASVYHYVREKEDILFSLISENLGRFIAVATELLDSRTDGPVPRLRALIDAHIDQLLRDPARTGLAFVQQQALVGARRAAVDRLRADYASIFRRVIADAQTAGNLRQDIAAKDLSLALTDLLNGMIVWYDPAGPLGAREFGDIFAGVFFDGVRARGPARPAGAPPASTAEAAEALRAVAGRDVEIAGTLQRIEAATIPLFLAGGYLATTTRDIAQASGIQNSTLYHHLRDKEEALYVIVRRALTDVARGLLPAAEAEMAAVDRVAALMRAHLVGVLRNQGGVGISLRDSRHLSGDRRREVLRIRSAIEDVFRAAIRSAQAESTIRSDIDARFISLALFNLTAWSVFWFRSGREHTAEELGGLLTSVFLDGATGQNPAAGMRAAPGGSRGGSMG